MAYLVAGTGLEPVSAVADMSPRGYNLEINSFISSLPIPVLKSFSLFKASDFVVKIQHESQSKVYI
jgi:hypothetical protein